MVQNRSCRYFKPELLFSCGLYSEHCELDSFSSLLFHSHNEDNILRSVDWISFNQEKLRTLSQESCDRVLKTQIQIQEKQDYLTQLQREDKEYYDQQIKLQRLLYERRRHFEERQRVSVECDRLSAYFERQINECQPRIDKLKLELKNFRPQVSKLQRQYDENRRKIDQRQRRIDRRQRQIVMREHRIDKNQELLGERNLLFRDDKIQVDELFCQYEARQCQSQLEKRIDEGNKRENDLWDRRYEEVMRQIDLIRRQTFECERLSKKGDRQYDENMRQSNERYDENMRQSNERQRQIDSEKYNEMNRKKVALTIELDHEKKLKQTNDFALDREQNKSSKISDNVNAPSSKHSDHTDEKSDTFNNDHQQPSSAKDDVKNPKPEAGKKNSFEIKRSFMFWFEFSVMH